MKDISNLKKIIVISAAPIIERKESYWAYSPYSKEMALWAKYFDQISFCCPIWNEDRSLLISPVEFKIAKVFSLREFSIQNLREVLKSFRAVFYNFYIILIALNKADHIHLRCPGNVGLLGCIAQIFFPSKMKSAKYAGNWDPKSTQPMSYKLQRWILSNTFLTRNMTVLVYGDWPNSSKNIKSFFTASYFEAEKLNHPPKNLHGDIKFVFVGTLTSGKNPLYAVRLVHELIKTGRTVHLDLYGEGLERTNLEQYIDKYLLRNYINLKGNCDEAVVRKAYQNSHFLILPSKSEGWPKVVAEAMFWGTIPLASAISCVPFMLDYGKQGIILELELQIDLLAIIKLINSEEQYLKMSNLAEQWSQGYTIDKFESELKLILN